MRRRQLLAALPVLVRANGALAQPAGKFARIGYLGGTSASEQGLVFSAFKQRLAELGWVEGKSAMIEQRWADGRQEPLDSFAAELVALRIDVVVTGGAPAVEALKRLTTTIPIVFYIATDPVGTGLIASLARPGGNVTGLSYQGPDLAGKRIEVMRELLPKTRRLAVLANVESAGAKLEMIEAIRLARSIGLEGTAVEVPRADTIKAAMAKAAGAGDAIYVCADAVVNANLQAVVEQALRLQLPSVFGERTNVTAGGLMSYGPSRVALAHRAAEIVNKILRGAKPADIPVEQPSKFELVVNLKTARTLGIAVPQSILARADEVIE